MESAHNNIKKQPIGIFDSGVGGLSVLIELKKILPNENFIFLADQAYLPYGEKSKIQLINRCQEIADYFINSHHVKMIIVACNTATANAIETLRGKYLLPMVGTIPALKPAALYTKSGTIAVLSTPSTSKSVALKNLIKNHCRGVKVLNVGCRGLVNAVEGGLSFREGEILLRKYLKNIKNSDADYVVLGCTQYPFLKKLIQKVLGTKIKIIDSGEAIAKHTRKLLFENDVKNNKNNRGKTIYFTTGNPLKFSKVAGKLLKSRVKAEKVAI